MPGSSSWMPYMPYAPQGVKEFDNTMKNPYATK